MFKLDLEKAEEPEIKLSASIGSYKKKSKRIPEKKNYFCFTDFSKTFDYVHHNKLWKILKKTGIPDTLSSSWETCMKVKKQKLQQDME